MSSVPTAYRGGRYAVPPRSLLTTLSDFLGRPAVAIAPLAIVGVAYVVIFTGWTFWISFTDSTILPSNEFVGLRNYTSLVASPRWDVSVRNLALYGSLFVVLSMLAGVTLAVLLDQRIRGETILRAIYLYPMALSFVVTGTIWRYIFNPSVGVERLMNDLGWVDFHFDWIVRRDFAIYTILIAALWQATGFVVTLVLAGLRSVDTDIMKAARVDGASPFRLYAYVVLPTLRPIFVAVLIIQLQFALKTYDLVVALTGGGPGVSTSLPTLVVYDYIFQRDQLGQGAAAAILLLTMLVVIALPYSLYNRWRQRREARGGQAS